MKQTAFEKWLKDSDRLDLLSDGVMKQAFEAGWNAARAEPRSAAADPIEIPAFLRAAPPYEVT